MPMKKFIHYLITDPNYYTSEPTQFALVLQNILQKQEVDLICFRDKSSSNIEALASECVNIANKHNKKVLINGNIDLALKLNAYGVHLRSNQFELIATALEKNLFVIISCHTLQEIKKAKLLGANMATFSPIFDTPNKGKAKGIEELKKIIASTSLPIIALGGIIDAKQIEQIQASGASGFASIRYFIQ